MIIEGDYDEKTWYGEVRIDGVPLNPARSQKVYNHSPDGFAWGYGGSGPAQLALAILLAADLTDRQAVALHQRFKSAFLASLPLHAPFKIDIDVRGWANAMMPLAHEPSKEATDVQS